MVGEIVENRDSCCFTPDLQTPLHALEGAQSPGNAFSGQSQSPGAGESRQRIPDVETSRERNLEPPPILTVLQRTEAGGLLQKPDGCSGPSGSRVHPERDDVGGRIGAQVPNRFIVPAGDQRSLGGDNVQQPPEALFDRRKIGIDVGMVILAVVEDDHVGQVVQELGTLVEEGGVVLVSFDHEVLSIGHPEAAVEIAGDASDQKGWPQSGRLQQPGQQRRRGGLSVCSRHHHRGFPADEDFLEGLRQGAVGDFLIQNRLHFRIASGDRVADHYQIGAGPEMSFGKSLQDGDPAILQEGGHGRVDIPVRAGDAKPLLLEHARQRGHGRAADTD